MADRAERRTAPQGFTIVELLIVIAIILVLAGLLFPAFHFARKRSHESTCMSQLRQVGQAFEMYLADHDAGRPAYLHQLYPNYVNDQRMWLCPNDAWVADGGWAWSAWGQFSTPARPRPCPMSYGYFWPAFPMDTRVEQMWLEFQQASDLSGYLVCVLHGQQGRGLSPTSAPFFRGTTLRVTFNGAVVRRQVLYPDDRPPFSVAKLYTD